MWSQVIDSWAKNPHASDCNEGLDSCHRAKWRAGRGFCAKLRHRPRMSLLHCCFLWSFLVHAGKLYGCCTTAQCLIHSHTSLFWLLLQGEFRINFQSKVAISSSLVVWFCAFRSMSRGSMATRGLLTMREVMQKHTDLRFTAQISSVEPKPAACDANSTPPTPSVWVSGCARVPAYRKQLTINACVPVAPGGVEDVCDRRTDFGIASGR